LDAFADPLVQGVEKLGSERDLVVLLRERTGAQGRGDHVLALNKAVGGDGSSVECDRAIS
jgi:hypothetical protein